MSRRRPSSRLYHRPLRFFVSLLSRLSLPTFPLLSLTVFLLTLLSLTPSTPAQLTHHTWHGSQSTSWMGFDVTSIREPNGARRLLIGQPRFNHVVPLFYNHPLAGAVRCYAGTDADGPPLFQVFGPQEFNQIGRVLAPVGDIDGDHYEDFAIGAPGGSLSASLNQEGFVLICSGADGEVLTFFIGPQDYSEFGASIAGVGDVNLDGIRDFAIGAPEYHATPGFDRHGRVYVYSGSNGALLQTFTGAAHSAVGASLAAVGDVDGDGRGDFAIGSPEDDTAAIQAGRVIVVRGGVGGTLASLYGDETQDAYGYALAGGGDCNDDGEDDLIVGSPGAVGNRGLVEVRLGPSFNTTYKLFISAIVGDRMGSAVDFAGDVDQDGFDDIVMGGQSGSGKVYGRSGQTGASILPAQTGVETGDGFGTSIAGVGDANGDGWDDVLVGLPFSDELADQGGGARLIGWQLVQPDLGGGGVGDTQLQVFGAALASGYDAQLQVSGAPSNAPAWLLASPFQLPLPFKGGTLVPNVSAGLLLFIPTNAQGALKLTIPGGGGPFSVYAQYLVQDAAQPAGLQLTHCIKLDFLP